MGLFRLNKNGFSGIAGLPRFEEGGFGSMLKGDDFIGLFRLFRLLKKGGFRAFLELLRVFRLLGFSSFF